MKQTNEDTNQSAHTGEDIVIEAQTLGRLSSVQKDGESFDETLNRLLDNSAEDVPIEKILTDLLNRYEDAVSINVDIVPPFEEPAMVAISVHTGEVGAEEFISLYEGKETHAVIESQAGQQFCLPFDIIATCDGPKRETTLTTPVYRTDTVLGLEPISPVEGLDRLRTKIGRSSEEVQELVYHH